MEPRSVPAKTPFSWAQRLNCMSAAAAAWPPPELKYGALAALVLAANLVYQVHFSTRDVVQCAPGVWNMTHDEFEDFDNVTGVEGGRHIVPNYVHFLRLGWWNEEFMFLDAVNVLAAFKNQRPDKLFIHTDLEAFSGKYWKRLMETDGLKEILVIERIEAPPDIFGQPFTVDLHYYFHCSDVLRIAILMRHGGIFLDNDSFLVRSLDRFRSYEMTLEWDEGFYLGTQTLIAHSGARFLRLWLESYRDNYRPHLWYYNAGEFPTRAILWTRPELVHRVQNLFGVPDMRANVFAKVWDDWRRQYSIHTFYRHIGYLEDQYPDFPFLAPEEIDDKNVRYYKTSLLEMAKSVYKFDGFEPDAEVIEPLVDPKKLKTQQNN